MKKVLLFLVLIGLLGCKKGKEGKVVAKVGSAKLTLKEFNAQIPEGYVLTKQQKLGLLDKWVNSELLYQEAKNRGIDKDENIQARLKQVEKEFIVNEFLQKEAKKVSITQADVFDYFNKHKSDFLYEVKILQIILPDSASAVRTFQDIKRGADFQKLARERSLDRSVSHGEPTKYFGRGAGDPLLEEEIFKLKPGEVSGIIKSADGYHIIKLVDKKQTKKDVSFDDVAQYIYNLLTYKRSRQLVDSLIKELKAKTEVKIYPESLTP